jgi:hypothetical protein
MEEGAELRNEWYYIDPINRQPVGPISLRDLDVSVRTNILDSNSYLWKEGMEEWKKIYQIDELKSLVSSSNTEITESLLRNQIQESYSQKAENNATQNYYFGSDGWWHVYNPVTKSWTQQETVRIYY